jgi:hypothetical protein
MTKSSVARFPRSQPFFPAILATGKTVTSTFTARHHEGVSSQSAGKERFEYFLSRPAGYWYHFHTGR